MKALFPLIFLAGATPATTLPAQQPTAHSPVLGKWAVDVSRLPVPPAARPKSVTMTFSERQAGAWRTDVDIRGGDGSARLMRTIVAPDGSVAQVTGDTAEADSVAMKLPAPNVLVMVLGKGGIPASTRVYTVAPDGKSMTETVGYAKDGKPFIRTNYFTRVD